MTSRVGAFLVGVVSFAIGCSQSSSPSASQGRSGTTGADGTEPGATATNVDGGAPDSAAASVGTPGCGASQTATGLQDKSLKVGSTERHYQLVVPSSYDANQPLALTFVFHGRGGDSAQIRSYLNMESESAGRSLFVYPDGLSQASQGGATGWELGDLKFFDALLAEISGAYCVDAKRVFAAGHSFGAYMTNVLGCQRGDVVRAIAPVSGGILPGSCKGPVAAWISHGDKDPTVSQREGIAARDMWIKVNGCGSTTSATGPDTCVTYEGCSAGYPVVWCSFSGGHYPLPSYTGQAIWDFFKAF